MAAKELTLENIGGGELIELVRREFARIGENIADPATRTDATRKVQISIAVKPDKKGMTADINYQVKTTLAPPEASTQRAYIAMAPGSEKITLFDMDIRQEDLFKAPKDPVVTEIKPQTQQATGAKMPEPTYAPPMKSN